MARKPANPAAPAAPAPASAESLFAPAVALVQRMVAVEKDPDLISVFSIARAHGYVPTSKFWHQELNVLAAALQAYAEANKDKLAGAAQQAAPAGEVVPLPQQS